MKYFSPTIANRSGKKNLYACVTVPENLRPIIGRPQIYKTLGTYDRTIAKQRLHGVTSAIYKQLDEAESQNHPLVLSYVALEEAIAMRPYKEAQLQLDWDIGDLFNVDRRFALEDDVRMRAGSAIALAKQALDDFEVGAMASEQYDKTRVYLEDFVEEFRKISQEKYAPKKRGILFKDVTEQYFASNDFAISSGRDKTKDDYKNNVQKFMDWVGGIALSDFDGIEGRKLMAEYADEMVKNRVIIPVYRGEGVSSATLRRHFAAVKGVLNFAFTQGLVENKLWEDYQKVCDKKGVEEIKPIAFSQAQIIELLALKKSPREQLLFNLCIGTGCRLDEIALLTWDRISFEVVGGLEIPFIDLTPRDTLVKRDTSHRRIPLVPAVYACLPPRNASPFSCTKEPDRLFNYGKKKDGKTEAASKAGMRIIRKIWDDRRLVNHSFRHYFINKTREVEEWMSPAMANYITGHVMEGSERSSYGDGYQLKVLYEAMCKIDFSFLSSNPLIHRP